MALPEKTKKFEIQIFKTFIFLRSSTELVSGTVPMTIFYNGSVSVFQVSRNKAGEIMKVANEAASKKDESSMETDLSVILPTTLRPKLFGQNLEGG